MCISEYKPALGLKSVLEMAPTVFSRHQFPYWVQMLCSNMKFWISYVEALL
jgi:hypothetical protein